MVVVQAITSQERSKKNSPRAVTERPPTNPSTSRSDAVFCQARNFEMIHVFNSPIDPSSMNEFQRSKRKGGEEIFKNATVNKRKVTYTKDGRRLVDGKIETEQKPYELWSAALTRSVASDWKDRCDDRLAQNGRTFWEHRKLIASYCGA
uniref:Uncharacterized protein n=1 Tax=Ascaris lumbricoides TaxID=6252 RepID=A0A0M3HXX8_ASCLU